MGLPSSKFFGVRQCISKALHLLLLKYAICTTRGIFSPFKSTLATSCYCREHSLNKWNASRPESKALFLHFICILWPSQPMLYCFPYWESFSFSYSIVSFACSLSFAPVVARWNFLFSLRSMQPFCYAHTFVCCFRSKLSCSSALQPVPVELRHLQLFNVKQVQSAINFLFCHSPAFPLLHFAVLLLYEIGPYLALVSGIWPARSVPLHWNLTTRV